jgi:hypothetical protein
MNILKTVFAVIAFGCISTLNFADLHVHNNTSYWLYVEVPFIGVGSPTRFDIAPGDTQTDTKDLANYKQDVYVKAYEEAPTNRTKGITPVAQANFGKGFGGSLADINIFTSPDAAGIETLKVAVEAR